MPPGFGLGADGFALDVAAPLGLTVGAAMAAAFGGLGEGAVAALSVPLSDSDSGGHFMGAFSPVAFSFS